jgi:predicted dehydrogenase
MSPKKKLHLIKKTPRFNIDAVMKETAKNARLCRHGIIKYYTDADAFINDPDIDATYEAFKNKEVPLFVAYY